MKKNIHTHPTLMKVAVCQQYGSPDVIDVIEHEIPQPKKDEIRVRVIATTVNSGDSRIRGLNVPQGFTVLMRLFLGFTKPRQAVLGTELSGIIDAIGEDVTRFNVGDKIFADCGMGMGAHAQYKLFKQKEVLCSAPKNLPLVQSSAISFGGSTAYFFLMQKGNLKSGERILINGASGSVGTASIQLAKHAGAHVTAVCSAKNHSLVLSLGADSVIDYQHEAVIASDQTYDVIMDNVGNLTWTQCEPVLNTKGRFLNVVASFSETVAGSILSKRGNKSIVVGTAFADTKMLERLKNYVDDGVFTPVIDRYYQLDDIQKAHAYVDTQHKAGSVVIVCDGDYLTDDIVNNVNEAF